MKEFRYNWPALCFILFTCFCIIALASFWWIVFYVQDHFGGLFAIGTAIGIFIVIAFIIDFFNKTKTHEN